ncbi:MAG: hypothetical protein RIR26_1097 [Pseudomonadota bacterium]|jgi:nitrilase
MKISCLQTNPNSDVTFNLNQIEQLLANIPHAEPEPGVCVLPEVFAVMGSDALRRESAQTLGDGIFRTLANWARSSKNYLIAGTHAETSPQPDKVFNTACAFSPEGALLNVYRKVHLFNLRDPQGAPLYCESDVFEAGNDSSTFNIVSGNETWHCMTIICYDLRFPEIVRREIHRSGPIDLLFVPAAFTHQTGKDHWEVLLRARAIENQCYVVACNQTGFHSEGRKRNWGHSMVIDPWGKVISSLDEEVGSLTVEIDKETIASARTRIPALQDRVFRYSE